MATIALIIDDENKQKLLQFKTEKLKASILFTRKQEERYIRMKNNPRPIGYKFGGYAGKALKLFNAKILKP